MEQSGAPPPGDLASPPAPPPPHDPGRPRRWVPRIAGGFFVVAMLVGVLWSTGALPCSVLTAQPECWVAMLPGPTRNVAELIEVEGIDTFGSEGELLLTTVLIDNQLTLREYIDGLASGDIDLVPREQLYPPGRSVEDARLENQILMADSQLDAKIAALNELDIHHADLPDGAEIVSIVDDSPASETDLATGDVITAVDGEVVNDVEQAVDFLGEFAPGDEVTLTVRADDVERDVTVELGDNPEDPGAPYVGVLLRNYQELPVDIAIDAGAIGGPSAGLAFSLGIVDRATPEDLTGGESIAVTGTINAAGDVGPIGGIVQKVVGAAEADVPAEVFLVPSANWEQAQAATPDRPVTLIRVGTLDEAVTALEDIAAGRQPKDAIAIG